MNKPRNLDVPLIFSTGEGLFNILPPQLPGKH